MKKLIRGIVDFRHKLRPEYRETFARLALGQSPDSLFIACSDSRVVPNLFASSDPGDLFVIRNVGNLVAPCSDGGHRSESDESEAAAIEFALHNLNVKDIIVCGHSECGAMQAIIGGRKLPKTPNLESWLRHGEPAHIRLKEGLTLDETLAPHNQLSQLNVLQQMDHIQTYPIVHKRVQKGELRIHGWWFDIAKADVYCFEESFGRFILFDDTAAKRILRRLDGTRDSFSV